METSIVLVFRIGILHEHQRDVNSCIVFQTVGVEKQFVGFAFPDDTTRNILTVDEANAQLQQIRCIRFVGIFHERELHHLAVGDIITIDVTSCLRRRSFVVRVLVEEVEGLHSHIRILRIHGETFVGQRLFDVFVDGGLHLTVVLIDRCEGKRVEVSEVDRIRRYHQLEGAGEIHVACGL